ncbi:MAG: 1-acyl-sn-glycerol-3-phosphate acyltransferase [Flavobacteriia bacterium]|nr:1-acyl-sn-glycerol-3-phosphate acyltransferase [Flavobacteriia bacterium]
MDKFIDVKKIIETKNKKISKFIPRFLVKYLENIIHQNEINQFLQENKTLKNQDFCQKAIEYLNIKINVNGLEKIPKSGACCIAMNHPLGGVDGISFLAALKDYRSDIVFIANDLLLQIKPLNDIFFGVNKHGRNPKEMYSNLDALFQSDKLICFFPAGLVSRRQKGEVKDLKWKKTFISYSVKHNVPVLPIFIGGKMSNFFYRLANLRKFLRIKTNFEMLYLSNEMFKQKNSTITFTVGDLILPEQFSENNYSHQKWAEIVMQKVYNLAKSS